MQSNCTTQPEAPASKRKALGDSYMVLIPFPHQSSLQTQKLSQIPTMVSAFKDSSRTTGCVFFAT